MTRERMSKYFDKKQFVRLTDDELKGMTPKAIRVIVQEWINEDVRRERKHQRALRNAVMNTCNFQGFGLSMKIVMGFVLLLIVWAYAMLNL